MRITISGDTDEERALIDPKWKALDTEARAKAAPKPVVIVDVVEYAMTGTRVQHGVIPTPFDQIHLHGGLPRYRLIGALHGLGHFVSNTICPSPPTGPPEPPKESSDGNPPV